jgi:hypothetical protein
MHTLSVEFDDMDGYDWVNWIDEYHCPDYWHSMDDIEYFDQHGDDYYADDDDFDDEGDLINA